MQKNWFLVCLFLMAGVLRFWNLGYSDYQGDEIKALYNPEENKSARFFLEQRKGPMQFLVTAGVKTFTPDYRNRFLVRLPFALAGFASVVVFYFLAKSLFTTKIAFYSSIFFATNGFLVAFSRIVQYQSLVIFFGLLAVYLTLVYTKTSRLKYLVWGFVSWAISVLSHYDAVFFTPVILGILVDAYLRLKDHAKRLLLFKHVLASFLILVTLSGLFYIPFVLNLSKGTTEYWAGRISGDVSNKISSSRYLFSVYQPIYVVHLYTLLGGIGLIFTATLILFKLFTKPVIKIIGLMYNKQSFTSSHQRFYLSLLLSLLLWFLIPFMVMEVLIYIPGTHIYTYLIPCFLLMSFTLFHFELSVIKYVKKLFVLYLVGIWGMTVFLFLQSYFVFVDHTTEYPWENKKFLIWTLPKPTPIFHLSMFGFPYYRHWDEIGDFIKSHNKSSYYTTNERESISRYHIPLQKAGEKAGYYVYILNPQTFTNDITNQRILNWTQVNNPIQEYTNNGNVVAKIYLANYLVQ